MNKYQDFIDDYPLFGLVEFRLKIPKIVKPLKIEIANIVYGYQQSHGFGLILTNFMGESTGFRFFCNLDFALLILFSSI